MEGADYFRGVKKTEEVKDKDLIRRRKERKEKERKGGGHDRMV